MRDRYFIYVIGGFACLSATLAFFFMLEKDVVSGAFCPALAQSRPYEGAAMDSYRMLVPGEHNRVFRTGNDFAMHYDLSAGTVKKFLQLQEALRKHGVDIVIAYPPVRGLVHADDIPSGRAAAYGLPDADMAWRRYEAMLDRLRKAGLAVSGVTRREIPSGFYHKRDHHWSAEGAYMMAEKVARDIRALPAFTDIRRTAYTTRKTGTARLEGSFSKAFGAICGTHLPPEDISMYKTEPAAQARSADEIFSDPLPPQIALLGTSNSVDDSARANFAGFLRHALFADVLNMAYAGAGLDDSLLSAMQSEAYRSRTLRMIVWEIPGYYDLNEVAASLLPRAIPAAHGACGDRAIFRRAARGLGEERVLLFEFRERDRQDGQRYYLHAAFTRAMTGDITLRFHYGPRVYKEAISPREGEHDIYLQLPEDALPEKITLQAPGMTGGRTDVTICPL